MPCGVGGGTHRSWPGGRGGRPRALIPGERVRVGTQELAWCTGGQGGGARARGGGARASVPGGGRGRDGANFATCVIIFVVSFVQKKEKWLWGGGGYPPELAWWTGVDQGP